MATVLVCVLWSCGNRQEARIQREIREKTTAFRIKKSAECQESLLSKAERLADSLLLAEAKQQLEDSLMRTRPFRPAKPATIPPIDSLQVKPIFPQ